MSTQRIKEELAARAGYDHVKFISSNNAIYTALVDENGQLRGISSNIKPFVLERRAEFANETDIYSAATRGDQNLKTVITTKHPGLLEKWQHDYVVSTLADLSNEFDNNTISNVTATNESLRPDEQAVYGSNVYNVDEILNEANAENVKISADIDRFGVDYAQLNNYLYAIPAGKDLSQDTDEKILLALAAQYGKENGVTVASLANFAAGFLMSKVFDTAFDLYDKGELSIIDGNGRQLTLLPPQDSDTAYNQADSMFQAMEPTNVNIDLDAINSDDPTSPQHTEDDADQIDISNLINGADEPAPEEEHEEETEPEEVQPSESEPEPIDLNDLNLNDDTASAEDDNESPVPFVPGADPATAESEIEPAVDETESEPVSEPYDEELTESVHETDNSESVVPEKVNELIQAVREAHEYARKITAENESLHEQVASLTKRSVDEINDSRAEIDRQKSDYESQRDDLQKQISSLKQQLGDVIMKEQDLNAQYEAVDRELAEANHRDELLAKIHENEQSISQLRAASE